MAILNKDKKQLQMMLTDISHQLKTPLAAISMYNEILVNVLDTDMGSSISDSQVGGFSTIHY